MPAASLPDFTVLADGGIVEGMGERGPFATVKFSVAWGSRYSFVNQVCGVFRGIPMVYPPSPNLYAKTADIEPLDGKIQPDGSFFGYTRARITVHFAVPEYSFTPDSTSDPSGQPWTTTTLDVSGEFFTVPDSYYHFVVGGKNVATTVPVGKVNPIIGITFKRHWVPFLPVAEMFGLAGKVNDSTFTIGDFICPPETLLFMGGPNEREADTAGDIVQTVSYKFSFKDTNWNKFLCPDGSSGYQYLFDGTGKKVYELGDFTILP